MARLCMRAEALVREMFPLAGRWASRTQDPRTTHTVALWQRVVGSMDYVLSVRNPVEVVESLRTKLTTRRPEELYGTWLQGHWLAMRLTEGERRCFVFYEDWLADPGGTARRLAGFLGAEPGPADPIDGLFDDRLHRRRAEPAPWRRRVPMEAVALHLLLRALATAESGGARDATALHAVASPLDADVRLGIALVAERERIAAKRRAIEGGWAGARALRCSRSSWLRD